MAAITAELRLEISHFRQAIKTAQGLSRNVMRAMGGLGASMFGGVAAAAKRAAAAVMWPFKEVGRGIAIAIGFQITRALGQIPATLQKTLQAGMSQQQMEIGMKGVESFEGGGKMVMDHLRDRVLKWGGNYQEMVGDVRKFVALGLKEQEALKFYEGMTKIGAGIGLSREDMTGATTAVLQMVSKEVVMSEELRGQMAERAIPIAKVLAEKRGQTMPDFWKSVEKKEVMPQEVIDAVSNMEGVFARFRGSADTMGQTLGGLFSRLKAHLEDFYRLIGADLVAAVEPWAKKGFDAIIGWKGALVDAFGAGMELMNEMSASERWQLATDVFQLGIRTAINVLWAGIQAAAAGFGTAMGQSVGLFFEMIKQLSHADTWKGLWEGLKAVFFGLVGLVNTMLSNLMTSVAQFLPGSLGDGARSAAEVFKAGAQVAGGLAGEALGKSVENLKRPGSELLEHLKSGWSEIGKSIKDNFNVSDVAGAGAFGENVYAQKKRFDDRMEQRRKAREAEKLPSLDTPGGTATAAGAASSGKHPRSERHRFFAEINALLGRSAEEALAEDSKRQTSLLEKIAENTKPKPGGVQPVKAANALVFN